MTVNIHAVHFHVDKKLQDFIQKKTSKLSKIDEQIQGVEVFLKLAKPEVHSNKEVEIKINGNGIVYFAKRTTNTFEASAIKVIEALRRQVLKNKNKSPKS